MKVVFVSNFINHHQLPFCDVMYNELQSDFNFIATIPISEERLKMGWKRESRPYVIDSYLDDDEYNRALNLINEADFVIIGSAPFSMVENRVKNCKLTLRYSERPYKKGLNFKNFLLEMLRALKYHSRYQKYPVYMLCASAYTPFDYSVFGNYINRTYKWGYFTEFIEYDLDKLFALKKNNKVLTVLWAGRLIDCKHPEACLTLAERLKTDGIDFKINIIGNGDMETWLKEQIKLKRLEDTVELLGSMSPQEVRRNMNSADIFLFTSDFNEGWGAVLNESMNSGCAVVVSHAIGAAPFLVKDGVNGLIYKNGDDEGLYRAVKGLIENEQLRREIAENAYKTIAEEWNPSVAAERLLCLARELSIKKECDIFKSGPGSRAEIIKNNWFNEYRY